MDYFSWKMAVGAESCKLLFWRFTMNYSERLVCVIALWIGWLMVQNFSTDFANYVGEACAGWTRWDILHSCRFGTMPCFAVAATLAAICFVSPTNHTTQWVLLFVLSPWIVGVCAFVAHGRVWDCIIPVLTYLIAWFVMVRLLAEEDSQRRNHCFNSA